MTKTELALIAALDMLNEASGSARYHAKRGKLDLDKLNEVSELADTVRQLTLELAAAQERLKAA